MKYEVKLIHNGKEYIIGTCGDEALNSIELVPELGQNTTISEENLQYIKMGFNIAYRSFREEFPDVFENEQQWINDYPGMYRCPVCNHTEGKVRNYCSDCGTKFKP